MDNSEINIQQGGIGNTQNNTFNYQQVIATVQKAAIPFQLPPTNVAFFAGRDDDLTEIHKLLQGNQRLAVSAYVKGMGGVGKTELAIQYALGHVLQDYRGGVCWLQTSEDLVIQLRSFVQVQLDKVAPESLTPEDLAQWCWKQLADRLANLQGSGCRFLVIIDDVKADYEKAVKPYLPPMSGNFVVLATTRLELGQAMQQYRLNVLVIDAAVDLLKSFLGPEDRRRNEAENIQKLCEWLGRLPLAVELVGRYLALPNQRDTSVADLLRRLQTECMEQLNQLTEGEKKLLPENLNVVASFNLSWQTLSPNAKKLACFLGLFALAPIPWQLVENGAVLQRKQNWLKSFINRFWKESTPFDRNELKKLRGELLNLNLIQREGEGIYQLHQLIREYFQFQLKQNPEWWALRQQVAAFLLTIAKSIGQTITLEQVNQVAPAIPHLEMLSRKLLEDIPDPDSNLTWAFTGVAWFYQGQGLYALAEDPYQRCLQATETKLGANHPHVAASLNNLGSLYESMGRYEEALGLYERSLSILEKQLGADHPHVAQTRGNIGSLYYSMGRYEEALGLLERSLSIREKQLGANHPHVAASLNNLGSLYESMGRYEEALGLLERSLSILEKQLGADHPDVATSLGNLAGLYKSMGRYEEALGLYERSLSIEEKQLGADHPDVATSLGNLGSLYESMGRYEEALGLYERSLSILEKQLGADHPHVATSLNNLAGLYYSMGRYEEALGLLERSLSILEKQLGADHPHVAQTRGNIGSLYYSMGRYEEALGLYERSLSIREKQLGADHPDVATSLNNLGSLYESMGRDEEALGLYERSLSILEKQLGADHPDVATSLNNLAGLYYSMGRYEEALGLLERSLSIREKQLGANHPDVATSLGNLGSLYESMGRYEEALGLLERAVAIAESALGYEHPNTVKIRNNLQSLLKARE